LVSARLQRETSHCGPIVLFNLQFSGTDFSQCTASHPLTEGWLAARSARVALLSYTESSKALAGLKLKLIWG